MNKQYVYLLIIILLSGITLFTYHFMERYQIVGDDLLLNGTFDDDLNFWIIPDILDKKSSVDVFSGYLLFASASSNSSVRVFQELTVPKGKFVRLMADVSTMNVVAGEKNWQKARVYFVNQVKGKDMWQLKHHLFKLDESHSWSFYQEEFKIHPQADTLRIAIQLPQGGGVIALDNLSAFVVEKKQNVLYFSYFLIFLWLVLAVLCIYYLRKQKHIYLLLMASSAVLSLMLIPHELKLLIIDWVQTALFIENKNNIIDLTFNQTNTIETADTHVQEKNFYTFLPSTIILTWSQLGHFFIFFFYTFLVMSFQKNNLIKSISFICILAMVTEILQLFTPDRQADIVDFMVNIMGIMVASVLFFSIKSLSKLKNK
ncbi:MAG: VanZ family protein [Gammaproteobacteria bacterium]|nr:VanZ family protein [Gammaproteobacteria bacterium]